MLRTRASRTLLSFGLAALACTTGCESSNTTATPQDASTQAATPAAPAGLDLAPVLASDHRSEENRTRDVYRHPQETLDFFGVTPSSTVIEMWPSTGWYTEILAPALRDQGKLIVTNFDQQGPADSWMTDVAKTLQTKFDTFPQHFDKVEQILSTENQVLGAPGTADTVLTFRNSHGWHRDGIQEQLYAAAFAALKPGGVLGIVQHRAPEGSDPQVSHKNGYLSEASIIQVAEKVGFKLEAKSEINANAKDTKDHLGGVWALPPRLKNKDQDKAKYLAIGESDRMTLKFVKPTN